MLRLRSTDGSVQELPETIRFVEICDAHGALAALVFRSDTGVVSIAEVGSPIMDRYVKTFHVTCCPLKKL